MNMMWGGDYKIIIIIIIIIIWASGTISKSSRLYLSNIPRKY